MAELTDVKPGDKVSFPAGGDVSTGTVEKIKVDGVGGSPNHTSDAAKSVEQESPEVVIAHGATTVVKPISEVEPEKPANNHTINFSTSPAIEIKGDKKDGREHIPAKSEHGIAPKDGLNGSVRARSKSPAVVAAPTAPKDVPVVDKKPEEPKVVSAAPLPVVVDKPPVPVAVATPPVAPVPTAVPAVPAAPVPVSTAPPVAAVPEVAVPPVAVPPVAVPPVAAPPAPAVAAPVPAAPFPPPTQEPEQPKAPPPAPAPAPATLPAAAAAAPKKPGRKPQAPKKERPPKRAATETGEPRRSKRNKPS